MNVPPPDTRIALIPELERRIREIESGSSQEFGHFGALDWWVCLFGSLIIPYALFLWLWP